MADDPKAIVSPGPPPNPAREQQSPVHLRDPIYAELGEKGLSIHWAGKIRGYVKKVGHEIKVECVASDQHYVRLGGKPFHLTSFHFHSPAEHWVEGKLHPVEAHIVHRNLDDGTLCALGAFLDEGDEADRCPKLLNLVLDYAVAAADSDPDDEVEVDLAGFLPANQQDYYRYEGSLTTPEFGENVSWAVLRDARRLNKTDLGRLAKVFHQPARATQPLNRRFVLATFRPGPAEVGKEVGKKKSARKA